MSSVSIIILTHSGCEDAHDAHEDKGLRMVVLIGAFDHRNEDAFLIPEGYGGNHVILPPRYQNWTVPG